MSLAVLCWVALVQILDHSWRNVDIVWGMLACLAVVVINVFRMSLMAQSLDYYEAIHSSLGDMFANSIFLIVVLGICLSGVRHEIFARL
jgi:C4-dicarboxylate transporter